VLSIAHYSIFIKNPSFSNKKPFSKMPKGWKLAGSPYYLYRFKIFKYILIKASFVIIKHFFKNTFILESMEYLAKGLFIKHPLSIAFLLYSQYLTHFLLIF
jgi:hypothetical protein